MYGKDVKLISNYYVSHRLGPILPIKPINKTDFTSLGAVGAGLSENIRETYAFLCTNYQPGDEIHLFGFSRGAYTVRCVAGLIDAVGLLTKKGSYALCVIPGGYHF